MIVARADARWIAAVLAIGLAAADDPPPPAAEPIFREVRDRTPLSYRENAAYAGLLRRARETPPDRLDAECRTDVLFADLASNPARYRGVPIRLQGTATLIHPLRDVPEPMAGGGQLYEAWVFTADGRGFPVALVFEDLPPDLPIGDGVRAFVVFRGFFFKLMAYRAGDKARFAPLLVGRIDYIPEPGGRTAGPATPSRSILWYTLPLGVLAAYVALRVVMIWQRVLASPGRRPRFGAPPTDQISPEALEAWLNEPSREAEASRNGDGEPGRAD